MLARLAVLSLVLTVAACVSPTDLKSTTAQHATVASPVAAAKTAPCFQRGYENSSGLIATRLTPLRGDRTDAYELVVRVDTFALAVLEFRPGVIEYWFDEGFVTRPDEHMRAMLAACR